MYPYLICNRCNTLRLEHTKCIRTSCDFESYRNAVWEYFGRRFVYPRYPLTLTGASNAGKTVYLITLINQLLTNKIVKAKLLEYGIKDIKMIDPISLEEYKRIRQAFSKGKLEFTKQDEPLSFFSLFFFPVTGKIFEVVLYNNSGEKIQEKSEFNTIDLVKDHELLGSATLHFIDPREDSLLNKKLIKPKDISKFGLCHDYDIVSAINDSMQRINRGVKLVNNPIGICISKFDLLNHLIPSELPEYHNFDASPDIFNDIDALSKELYQFLVYNSATINPDELQDRYENIRYFPVAPTGNDRMPATSENNMPRGVLAPFLWVLKELLTLPKYNNGTNR